jgi:hypothetical protein
MKIPAENFIIQKTIYDSVVSKDNCADKVKSTKFLFVVICMESNPYITVFKRQSMELLYEKQFQKGIKVGTNIGHVDRRGEKVDQTYLFVTLNTEILILEFLLDEVVEDADRKTKIFEFTNVV